MTGVTTGQTSLATATDSDDTESYLTTSLVTNLQALANLFESATGHDHTGAGKGKPIGSAGIASGVTLASPHFTSPVVDSGGLVITGSALTIGGATAAVTAGQLGLGATFIAMGGGAAPTLGTIGGTGPATAAQNAWWRINIGGTNAYIPYWV